MKKNPKVKHINIEMSVDEYLEAVQTKSKFGYSSWKEMFFAKNHDLQ